MQNLRSTIMRQLLRKLVYKCENRREYFSRVVECSFHTTLELYIILDRRRRVARDRYER